MDTEKESKSTWTNYELAQYLIDADPQELNDEALQKALEVIKPVSNRVQRMRLMKGLVEGPTGEHLKAFAEKKEREKFVAELGAPPKCLVVFDFDQTLVPGHVFRQHVGDRRVIVDRVWGGAQRVKTTKDTFSAIEGAECKVVVLTRNSRQIVTEALTYAGLKVFRVIGYEDYDWSGESPKSGAIAKLLEPWGLAQSHVLFADDDVKNIENVRDNLPEVKLVQPTDGLTSEECLSKRKTKGCPHGLMEKELASIAEWAKATATSS